MLELELVLPCYNESKSLQSIVERTIAAAQGAGFSEQTFQLVLVENGSKDDSQQVLAGLKQSANGKWFRVVNVNPNIGYGNGIFKGLQSTSAKFVAWSHADQQCDPVDVFKGMKTIQQRNATGPILVKGTRSGRAARDRFVSFVFGLFAKVLLGLKCDEINAQPKVFPRELLERIHSPPLNFSFDLYVLYCAQKAGYSVQEIPVLFPPRIHGFSNWSANFFSRYKTILGMINYMRALAKQQGRLR